MAAITIKNLPEEIYGALQAQAREHGRSLNREVVSCLKAALATKRLEEPDILASVDRIRSADGVLLRPDLLDQALKSGRP